MVINPGRNLFNYVVEQGEISRRIGCGRNLVALGTALNMYADRYDGRYPAADSWCDSLVDGDYITKRQLKCPADRKGPSSYSLNRNIAGANRTDIPRDVVLLFESKPGWSQVGGSEILTTDYNNGEGCHVLFNDGHVDFVKTKHLGKLKWKVEEPDTVK
jgi:prepilin-type processing-associated H-X9-DG protein